MVQGRKTLHEQYTPYLFSLFSHNGNVEVALTHEFYQEELLQLTVLLMMYRDGLYGKHTVPLHLTRKTILTLAVAPYLQHLYVEMLQFV